MSRNEKLEIIIAIENKEIKRNKKLFLQIWSKLNGEIKITFQRNFRKRTNPMNAFLWGIIYPIIVKDLFNVGILADIEDVHEFCKDKFLPKVEKVNTVTGEIMYFPGSTKSLSTTGMNEYWIAIRHYFLDYIGSEIPDPDPMYFLNKKDNEPKQIKDNQLYLEIKTLEK